MAGLKVLTKHQNIDTGDSGKLNVQSTVAGIKFTILDHAGTELASVTLDIDRAHWIIGVLCKLTGVTEIKGSLPKTH